MTTDFEDQHPRKGTGRFDQKAQSAPEVPPLGHGTDITMLPAPGEPWYGTAVKAAKSAPVEPLLVVESEGSVLPAGLIDPYLRVGVARAAARAAEAEYQQEVIGQLATYLERHFPGAGRITFRCDPEAGYEEPSFRSVLQGNAVLLSHKDAGDDRVLEIGAFAAQLASAHTQDSPLKRVRRQEHHEYLYSLDLTTLR
jgi:hypothetical protein